MEEPSLTVKRVPLDSLQRDPSNPRLQGPENLEAILGRLVAVRKLGWRDRDVVEVDVGDLTATPLGIALNRTSDLASFDEAALSRLLQLLTKEAMRHRSIASTMIYLRGDEERLRRAL